MSEPTSDEIQELKETIATLKSGARFRNYVLLALALATLPIALTLASTSYSYTQKVGDTSVVVVETKGWIGDVKDWLGILAPAIVGSPLLASYVAKRQKQQKADEAGD